MTNRLRNVSVGVVVITALGILGWMIFKFGAAPAQFFTPPQFKVTFYSPRGDGLGGGSNISYLGVVAGRVEEVYRDTTSNQIVITASLYKSPPLPANLIGNIVFTSPLGGVSSLDLVLDGPEPVGTLAADAKLKARYLGSTFLPPEFTELARNANETIVTFNRSKVIEKLAETVDLTKRRIDEAGKVIDGASSLINDPKLRENLQAALTSLRETMAQAEQIAAKATRVTDKVETVVDSADKTLATARGAITTTEKRIDEIGQSLGQQLVKVSKLLDEVTAVAAKINTGTGTAGQLVNDPRLYQSLVDTTRELNAVMTDARRLVQQWEQEGVTLKLGK